MSLSITLKGLKMEVFYDYTPEEPMVWTLPNGDPGHPGSAAQIDIIDVTHGGLSIMNFIQEIEWEEVLEKIVESKIEQDE